MNLESISALTVDPFYKDIEREFSASRFVKSTGATSPGFLTAGGPVIKVEEDAESYSEYVSELFLLNISCL
jgi:hypothetical protein